MSKELALLNKVIEKTKSREYSWDKDPDEPCWNPTYFTYKSKNYKLVFDVSSGLHSIFLQLTLYDNSGITLLSCISSRAEYKEGLQELQALILKQYQANPEYQECRKKIREAEALELEKKLAIFNELGI